MSSLLYSIIAGACLFGFGFAGGMRHHAGQDAIAAVNAQAAIDADRKAQQATADKAINAHVATIKTTKDQLGTAREKIAKLTAAQASTACLSADTVRVLDAIGAPVRAVASSPASAPTAVAADSGGDATAGEVAESIANCRAQYATVADQLSQILDIEDQRQKGTK